MTAKDLILYLIGQLTTDGGTGYCIEYTGEAIRALSMEERMTVCNMSIEAGARAGMIAPDETTFDYLRGREFAPADFDAAVERWQPAAQRPGAQYDRVRNLRRRRHRAASHLGHQPRPGGAGDRKSAQPDRPGRRKRSQKSPPALWNTWAFSPAAPLTSLEIDRVFIGSCTNSRIEDLRAAAAVVRGHHVADRVHAMVVPGSGQVKEQAEQEGLDRVFTAAGFEWREAGCSMCLAMNPDKLEPGERCASTSNRNFEGRQGKGGRTHLVSPAMAAAAAVAGHFVDIRDWKYNN